MKTINEPLPSKRRVKASKHSVKTIIGGYAILLMVTTLCGYYVYDIARRQQIYDNLSISFAETKVIEYGTANYNPMELVEEVDGTITSYTESIDTNTLGVKQVVFEVQKEDVVKEIAVEVEVKDVNAPVIKLKKKSITVYKGNNYNVRNNISSVIDDIDGTIKYYDGIPSEMVPYYVVESNYNSNKTGKYTVTIKAYDSSLNKSESSYVINVIDRVYTSYNNNYTNANPSVDTSSVVSAAYSFLGYRYRYGGKSPSTGFDCSGFVSYVYSLFGVKIGGGAKSLAHVGSAVSRSNMTPGDIIVWSEYSNNSPTHVSLYVGNGKMIHAANTRTGVIVSTIYEWENYGGGHIVTIRRV